MAKKTYTLLGLAKALQVDDRTVRRWIKKGCPTKRVKGTGRGRPKCMFDIDKVSEWLVSQDITSHIEDSTDSKTGHVPEPKQPAGNTDVANVDINADGLIGAIARLRTMERVTYSAFVQAVKNKEQSVSVRGKEKIYLETHQALRRTEDAMPMILKRRGDMLSLETVLEEQSKIDMAIKNQFLTLPRKIAVTLAAVSDPAEIEEILSDEIDDCLRHISNGK